MYVIWLHIESIATVQSLYNTMFEVHRNAPCYKWILLYRDNLERNYMKMTILWSFSYNSFVKFVLKSLEALECLRCCIYEYSLVKFVLKRFRSHKMSVLPYVRISVNNEVEVCYSTDCTVNG